MKNKLETLKEVFKPPKKIAGAEHGVTLASEDAIRKWIKAWIKYAEAKIGVPQPKMARKIDFKNDDLFYFTNCNDIVDKDLRKQTPEETYRKMYMRKNWHLMKLFLQYLIDDMSDVDEGWKHCGHCGKNNCELESLSGLGHYNRCPDCGRTTLVVYEATFNAGIAKYKEKVFNKQIEEVEKEVKKHAIHSKRK